MVAALLAVSLLTAGCAKREPTAKPPADREVSADEPELKLAKFEEVDSPITVRTIDKPGLLKPEDYDRDRLIVTINTGKQNPANHVGVMDLKTGKLKVIIKNQVRHKENFFLNRVRLGPGWIAWEEVSPNEGDDMRNASAYLFAATLSDSGEVGKPIEIDKVHTSKSLRFMHGFNGRELIWNRSNITNSASELVGFDTVSGKTRVIARVPGVISRLRISEGAAVIEEVTGTKNDTVAVAAIDLKSGKGLGRVGIPKGHMVYHMPQFRAGTFVWSSQLMGAEWPDLWVAKPGQQVERADVNSIDATFLGKYVVYKQHVRPPQPGSVMRQVMKGVDLETGKRFEILKEVDGLVSAPIDVPAQTDHVIVSRTTNDGEKPAVTHFDILTIKK